MSAPEKHDKEAEKPAEKEDPAAGGEKKAPKEAPPKGKKHAKPESREGTDWGAAAMNGARSYPKLTTFIISSTVAFVGGVLTGRGCNSAPENEDEPNEAGIEEPQEGEEQEEQTEKRHKKGDKKEKSGKTSKPKKSQKNEQQELIEQVMFTGKIKETEDEWKIKVDGAVIDDSNKEVILEGEIVRAREAGTGHKFDITFTLDKIHYDAMGCTVPGDTAKWREFECRGRLDTDNSENDE